MTTEQSIEEQLYNIFNMVVQGVQEIPADKSDKSAAEKMNNYFKLRHKWIEQGIEQLQDLITKSVVAGRIDFANELTDEIKNVMVKRYGNYRDRGTVEVGKIIRKIEHIAKELS